MSTSLVKMAHLPGQQKPDLESFEILLMSHFQDAYLISKLHFIPSPSVEYTLISYCVRAYIHSHPSGFSAKVDAKPNCYSKGNRRRFILSQMWVTMVVKMDLECLKWYFLQSQVYVSLRVVRPVAHIAVLEGEKFSDVWVGTGMLVMSAWAKNLGTVLNTSRFYWSGNGVRCVISLWKCLGCLG